MKKALAAGANAFVIQSCMNEKFRRPLPQVELT